MDTLDIRILRSLLMGGGSFFGNDVRRSYKAVADRVKVSEDTVRNRVDRFQRSGFIRGWKLGINPGLLGRQANFLFVDVNPPSRKEDVLGKIALVDGVAFILSYFGNRIGVHITFQSEQDFVKKRELIRQIAASRDLVSTKLSIPAMVFRLTATDLGLIKALRRNPRKPFGMVAREVGVSPRTAKRRTEKMVQSGVIYTLPDIDVGKLKGTVIASLSVFFSDDRAARETGPKIISTFEERLLIFHMAGGDYGWFGFALPNITMANEVDSQVKRMAGVRDTSVRLVEGFNLVDEELGINLERSISPRIPVTPNKLTMSPDFGKQR